MSQTLPLVVLNTGVTPLYSVFGVLVRLQAFISTLGMGGDSNPRLYIFFYNIML